MQPSHLSHQIVARSEMQMVRVRENHPGAGTHEIVGIERLHCCERTDRHECGRLHRAVRRAKDPAPCRAVGRFQGERERLH